MRLPRIYLLLIASVASVQLLLRSGSPHEALKGQETTCTCCSEDAEMQESGNSRWEKMEGAEWCEVEGLAATFWRGILDFLGRASASSSTRAADRIVYQFM